MKKDDTVKFIGIHSILKTNETYKVFSASETGVQLVTSTGFAGVPLEDVILISIADKRQEHNLKVQELDLNITKEIWLSVSKGKM